MFYIYYFKTLRFTLSHAIRKITWLCRSILASRPGFFAPDVRTALRERAEWFEGGPEVGVDFAWLEHVREYMRRVYRYDIY